MKKPILTLDQVNRLMNQTHVQTPFYVYDEEGIRNNVRKFLKAFSWNDGFKEYFAIKANPNPVLLKILQDEGCGVDCSSYTELMLAEALDYKASDIFFSSNNTPSDEFIFARKLNARINLDDITHIDFLNDVAGLPEEVCCRFNPGQNFHISNAIMDSPEEAKYGFTYEQLVSGYQKLKTMGVKKFGIHAFLASNCIKDDYYPSLAKLLFEVAVMLKKDHNINLSFVNLSGGIGIPYLPDEKEVDIEYVGKMVQKAFNEILVPNGLGNVKIYSELGRFVLGPYGQLVTKVIHLKQIYKNYIGVDACAANLIRPAMYKAYHHITVLNKKQENLQLYDVVGALCENNDKFAIDRYLPQTDIGDFIVIHDAGAHGHSMGYNYNGRLRCAEILYKRDGTFQVIRRAETPKDYFATLDFLNLF